MTGRQEHEQETKQYTRRYWFGIPLHFQKGRHEKNLENYKRNEKTETTNSFGGELLSIAWNEGDSGLDLCCMRKFRSTGKRTQSPPLN